MKTTPPIAQSATIAITADTRPIYGENRPAHNVNMKLRAAQMEASNRMANVDLGIIGEACIL